MFLYISQIQLVIISVRSQFSHVTVRVFRVNQMTYVQFFLWSQLGDFYHAIYNYLLT
jgi:hypothetical protein